MATENDSSRGKSPGQAPDAPQPSGRGPEDFDDFVSSTWEAAIKSVTRLGVPRSDAEDVVNGSFYRVQRDWKRIEHPRAWFYRVLRWEALNWFKANPVRPIDVSSLSDADKILVFTTQLVNPEELHEGSERTDPLMNAIHELTFRQRTMLIRRAQQFTHAEIAEELGMTPGAVRQMCSRITKRLEALLPEQKTLPGADLKSKGTEASA